MISTDNGWSIENMPGPRHLRVFEAVARLQSFTKAAEEVCLTQPAVTQAVAKLEASMGRQLLERAPGRIYLTEFGQKYLNRIRRFFQHIESALREINAPEDNVNLLSKMFRITRTQIRCHVAIAQLHSFARAGKEAGISQTSMHRAARELELKLDVQLYRNSSSGKVPTEAGRILAKWFMLALHEMQTAMEELSTSAEIEPDVLTIGVQILDPAHFLAVVMQAFTKAHPDCSIRVVNSTYDDLLQRIRLGLVDFIVGVMKEGSPDLHHEPLFDDPYVVVGRQGHPLTEFDRITPEQLLNYDWVVPNPGAPRRQAFDAFFKEAGRVPRTTIESHSYATIRATICEGNRLAILTHSEILADERLGVLQSLRTDTLHPTPTISLMMRDGQTLGPRRQALADLLRSHGRKRSLAR
jgi:DNA-binding transcriptional LysR family regulator